MARQSNFNLVILFVKRVLLDRLLVLVLVDWKTSGHRLLFLRAYVTSKTVIAENRP